MPTGDFRAIFLPYCLEKQANGSYVILNRNYKPIGFNTTESVVFAQYPISVKIPGIKPAVAAKLSISRGLDTKKIFLYDDQTVPTRSKKNMTAYLNKLEILAKLKLRNR